MVTGENGIKTEAEPQPPPHAVSAVDPSGPLTLFHPLVAAWFTDRVGVPTAAQQQAWPRIAGGEHVLITAPTGSGKTLTAFLWAIDRLVTGAWPCGHTSVLYVSPLRALNNDIRRNLLTPLDQLRSIFDQAGEPFPDIRVLTRSGDTPQADRRRMLRHPPEILITTPESLNLLLSSHGGRSILTGLSTVILDEIHAVVGNKRGVHLITAVDRLVPLCGEFQRIALSATVRPLDSVAAFVGGSRLSGHGGEPRYEPRQVAILESAAAKRYDVQVRFPAAAADPDDRESVWGPLVDEFKAIIQRNTSTLLFANSRRLCEKLTLFINSDREIPWAYAHHGSLSREIRETVERKLKQGDLKAIVSTSSLELGIDIGALDEVVLVQSPPSVSAAIQRLGRAGHRVGETSRGTLFPTHSHDFLEAAVLADAILPEDIESMHPVDAPLDVLAQVIISMVGIETWDIDELFHAIRSSHPYRELARKHFDLVLDMLAGRYAHSRVRELRARVSIDRLDNSAVARKGALQELYMSGGTIPDRGYFHLRHRDSNARIGELDEEFVWESSEGQSFTLGTQNWTIQRITHNDVFVTPAPPKPVDLPFWKADGGNRDFHFSQRLAEFLEEANARLDDAGLVAHLQRTHEMDETSAQQLKAFLERQREVTGCDLPHRHHVVMEKVNSGPDGYPGTQLVLHTLWGGRVNRPFAMALEAAWDARFGQRLEIYPSNNCIVVLLPDETRCDEILSLVTAAEFESLLRHTLEGSAFFGARFRECAGRALLVTRSRMNQRMPLWVNRLRSQKLLDTVMRFEDFPILLESWRTCMQDEFDVPAVKMLLAELESGAIGWTEIRTARLSPFAQGVAWEQVNEYMYMSDELAGGRTSRLSDDLIREVVDSPDLRPAIAVDTVRAFELKRQRLSPGYAPTAARDLLDWVGERLIVPRSEFDDLVTAMQRDAEVDAADIVAACGDKLVYLSAPGTREPLVAALENIARLAGGLFPSSDTISVTAVGDGREVAAWPHPGEGAERDAVADVLPEADFPSADVESAEELLEWAISGWLQYYGPRARGEIAAIVGVDSGRLQRCLDDLREADIIVIGPGLVEGAEEEECVCDRDNLEALLRLSRALAVPVFEPLELDALPLFLAAWQGLTEEEDGDPDHDTARRVEQLLCYDAPAALWESEILPARLRRFSTAAMDTLMQETPLRWVGHGEGRISFCFEPDLDLLEDPETTTAPEAPTIAALFADPAARYDFRSLLRQSGLGAEALTRRLWSAVWQGELTNDTLSALHKGVATGFKVPRVVERQSTEPAASTHGRHGRAGAAPARRGSFARWQGSLPYAGSWHLLDRGEPADDLLETEERCKDRVRLLFDRYGFLFRELLQRELPPFRWAALFRSLRLMELSGEVVSGFFFEGIPGPQFASHRAFRLLQRALPEEAVFWINACDPISPCGVPLPTWRGTLPRRLPGNHLVFHGRRRVLVSERHGKSLTIAVPPHDSNLTRYFGVLHHLLTRPFQSVRQLTVEAINGEPAGRSAYVDDIKTCFEARVDYTDLILYRR